MSITGSKYIERFNSVCYAYGLSIAMGYNSDDFLALREISEKVEKILKTDPFAEREKYEIIRILSEAEGRASGSRQKTLKEFKDLAYDLPLSPTLDGMIGGLIKWSTAIGIGFLFGKCSSTSDGSKAMLSPIPIEETASLLAPLENEIAIGVPEDKLWATARQKRLTTDWVTDKTKQTERG